MEDEVMAAYTVGDRVRLTGPYLKATGQCTGPEGRKTWTVRACGCGLCKAHHVAVDERLSDTCWFTPEELAADPRLVWRHIHADNLYRVGTMAIRNYVC